MLAVGSFNQEKVSRDCQLQVYSIDSAPRYLLTLLNRSKKYSKLETQQSRRELLWQKDEASVKNAHKCEEDDNYSPFYPAWWRRCGPCSYPAAHVHISTLFIRNQLQKQK
jgi:hypothetical protein